MRVLAIETSCDETAVAVYDGQEGLRAHSVYSQTDLHAIYGGVVPELASRDHVLKLLPLIKKTLQANNITTSSINGIAYTAGPGLIGALLVGAMFARSLAYVWSIPAVGVHHLEGHLLAPMLEANPPEYPFVALLVSGGHSLLARVSALGEYAIIGDTLDDAAGEAFDKTAKLLGLGYPGGTAVEKLAQQGRPGKFNFTRPMVNRQGLDFSFSGLKTAVYNAWQESDQSDATRADIAHAFLETMVDTLMIKCRRALSSTGYKTLVAAGGVSANQRLRTRLTELESILKIKVCYPRLAFCTDNAAMIAYVGYHRLWAGQQQNLSVKVKPRWSLSELNAIHT